MSGQDRHATVSMMCPTCGGTEFQFDDHQPDGIVECAQCGLSLTRDALIEANQELINAQIEQMASEVTNDLTRAFSSGLSRLKGFKVKK